MLIRNVELDGRLTDFRVRGGKIDEIAPSMPQEPGEGVLDGCGGAAFPGLHDHHIHLFALAASLQSVPCGPPLAAAALADRLKSAAAKASGGWVRGVGYHESVAGEIDRVFLDACTGDVPVRVQHRSGRLWILNTAALDRLLSGASDQDAPLEREGGSLTGRLYDADGWLAARMRSKPPSLAKVGSMLAEHGVTGVTDAGHANNPSAYAALRRSQQLGELTQDLLVFGRPSLAKVEREDRIRPGAVKFHLHDNAPPDLATFAKDIETAHNAGRPIAVHCVTLTDLVVTLSCLGDVGSIVGDRIEHASLASPDLVEWMARLGVAVVTQPHFITERGDSYVASLDASETPWLYPAGSLLDAGIPLGAGSDAPYGGVNAWASMQAAVDRRTSSGVVLGVGERLTPEAALALYTSSADQPGGPARRLAVGAVADICLLDRPWAQARLALGDAQVRLTLKAGVPTFVDRACGEKRSLVAPP